MVCQELAVCARTSRGLRLHVGGVVGGEEAPRLALQRVAERGGLAAAERLARRQHRLRPLQHLRMQALRVTQTPVAGVTAPTPHCRVQTLGLNRQNDEPSLALKGKLLTHTAYLLYVSTRSPLIGSCQ